MFGSNQVKDNWVFSSCLLNSVSMQSENKGRKGFIPEKLSDSFLVFGFQITSGFSQNDLFSTLLCIY